MEVPSSVEFMVPAEISHIMSLEHEEVDHSAVRRGKNEFHLSSEATLDLHCPNKKNVQTPTVDSFLKRRCPDPYCGFKGGHEGERGISWVRNNWFWQKEKQGIALHRWPRPLRTEMLRSSVGGEVRRMNEPWKKEGGDEQRKSSSCLKLSPWSSVQEGSCPLWHLWHSPAATVQLPPLQPQNITAAPGLQTSISQISKHQRKQRSNSSWFYFPNIHRRKGYSSCKQNGLFLPQCFLYKCNDFGSIIVSLPSLTAQVLLPQAQQHFPPSGMQELWGLEVLGLQK